MKKIHLPLLIVVLLVGGYFLGSSRAVQLNHQSHQHVEDASHEQFERGSNGGKLFRKGDFIQIGPTNGRYVYQVTTDVSHSTASNVTVPVHRPVIAQNGFTAGSRSIAVGSDVDWRVKLLIKPKYSIIPHDRIAFDEDFELIEVIRKDDG